MEYVCKSCGSKSGSGTCPNCGSKTSPSDIRNIDIIGEIDAAAARLQAASMPKLMKGVKGLSSSRKSAEALEKGILRATRWGTHIQGRDLEVRRDEHADNPLLPEGGRRRQSIS